MINPQLIAPNGWKLNNDESLKLKFSLKSIFF